jgi:DNA-binding transcriptional ArsR family regulator
VLRGSNISRVGFDSTSPIEGWFMITLRFPERSEDLVSFEVSALLEAVHSWHVLVGPRHHALHLPWVRACRRLAPEARRRLRRIGWVVADYVPACFEVAAEHPDACFADQLERLAAIDPGDVAVELARTLVDTSRWSGPELVGDGAARARALAELTVDDPWRAERLRRALTAPDEILDEVIAALRDYWAGGFDREWARVEPLLHDRVAYTRRRMGADGIVAVLRTLVPEVRLDSQARTMTLPSGHEHVLDVADKGGIRFTPSHYAWPHVRITCDEPWPLRVTYPVAPVGVPPVNVGGERELLVGLRALGAGVRLDIVRLLHDEPRSTQELAGLLGLSSPAMSRHLRQLLDAGIVTTQRHGYYVLYELRGRAITRVSAALRQLAATRSDG